MKKITSLAFLFSLLACDDGDFNVPSFDFEAVSIDNCGDLVLYKISSEEKEALILQLDEANEAEDAFFKTEMQDLSFSIEENGSHQMIYRIFNQSVSDAYFCQDIPPSTPTVSEEWHGNGNLVIDNTLSYDDNDLVESSVEDRNADGDGYNDDTDQDGYPDFIDIDDDGDNILTKNEDLDGDGDPTNDDSDNDGTPNYLDPDDDGDGTPTANESQTADENQDTVVDYLDSSTNTFQEPTTPATNYYTQYYDMHFEFTTLNFSNSESEINYIDGYSFGSKTGSFTLSELP